MNLCANLTGLEALSLETCPLSSKRWQFALLASCEFWRLSRSRLLALSAARVSSLCVVLAVTRWLAGCEKAARSSDTGRRPLFAAQLTQHETELNTNHYSIYFNFGR